MLHMHSVAVCIGRNGIRLGNAILVILDLDVPEALSIVVAGDGGNNERSE